MRRMWLVVKTRHIVRPKGMVSTITHSTSCHVVRPKGVCSTIIRNVITISSFWLCSSFLLFLALFNHSNHSKSTQSGIYAIALPMHLMTFVASHCCFSPHIPCLPRCVALLSLLVICCYRRQRPPMGLPGWLLSSKNHSALPCLPLLGAPGRHS